MFLKAKKLMANKEISAAEALVYINEAVEIEDEIQKTKAVKNAQLGRYYYVQGTLNGTINNQKLALACYIKASNCLKTHDGY